MKNVVRNEKKTIVYNTVLYLEIFNLVKMISVPYNKYFKLRKARLPLYIVIQTKNEDYTRFRDYNFHVSIAASDSS